MTGGAPDHPARMIAHLSIGVRDLDAAVRFYNAVFAPLGYVSYGIVDGDPPHHPFRSCGFGPPGGDPWAIGDATPFWLEERPDAAPPTNGAHVCFSAPTRDQVHAFHAAGLQHGATDDGAPGPRPHYGEGYYAAFLIDPEGWKIEAVTYHADRSGS
ncbi:MAG: VOC family protein [Pseudomonadota bacterium]